MKRYRLVTGPSVEPVTLADAKAFCRIEVADDDALVTIFISAARDFAERYTQRSLLQQTWKLSMDLEDVPFKKRFFYLQKAPIISIASITAYSIDNTPSVVDPATYRLSGDCVVLNDSAIWPQPTRCFDAMEVIFAAGYGGSADTVPPPIVQAIKMLVAHYYENREAAGDPVVKSVIDSEETTIPFGVTQLLQAFRIFSV